MRDGLTKFWLGTADIAIALGVVALHSRMVTPDWGIFSNVVAVWMTFCAILFFVWQARTHWEPATIGEEVAYSVTLSAMGATLFSTIVWVTLWALGMSD